MKYQEIIAIDPDCELSGVACVDTRNGEIEVFKKSFGEVLDYLKEKLQEAGTPQGKLFKVVIEAGWLIEGNWHVKVNKYMTPNKAAAMGRSVGRNHQTGILMHELCKRYMIPVELQPPPKKCWEGKDGKITQREIEQVTEHPKLPRMNQDQRDALLIAWVHSQLPMKAVTVQAKNNAGTLKRQR